MVVWPLGLLLFLGGWGLRVWAQQHVCYRLKTAKALTTSGPYSMVQNPIYIGNTLIVLGVVVMSELFWLVPSTGLWCRGVYALVVRYEERQLHAKYGVAYHAYQAAVPRWLPRVPSTWATGHGRADLLQALVVECHVVLMVAPVVLKEVFFARFME
ncbi:MAG: isoprenylcysteine carboxylmethyltransferase family protein [Candidatus Tectomicrobia bacterium]|nr:isoprenylcysteine carboxylmethyltransferase family protein [Candidatus Tectomicrobia bacterium]